MSQRIRQPWERLPKETDAQYAAFVAYRDLGPARTFREAAKDQFVKAKEGTLSKWARQFDWQGRAGQYDLAQQMGLRRQRLLTQELRRARFAELGQKLQKRGEAAIDNLSVPLTAEEARRFIETGVKIEANALEIGDGREELTQADDLANLSNEELARIASGAE